MKVLSVIVPTYNTESYLGRCLDSLLYDESIIEYLDIIVVDDGSSDGSAKLGNRYSALYPKSVSVIEKENGGHGSAINCGFASAKGKYIKVLDSDDWFGIDDFSEMVLRLKDEDADIVVTNYKREVVYSETEIVFDFSKNEQMKKTKIQDAVFEVEEPEFFFKFSMPSMAVKKDVLKKVWGEGLLEHTFYVDQQFVAKVLIGAESFVVYDLDIYRHFIGRPGQSIAAEGFYNHRHDHERVLRNLLEAYSGVEDAAKRRILKKQLELMLDTHYSIYKQKSKKELILFDEFIKNSFDEFYLKERFRKKRAILARRKK